MYVSVKVQKWPLFVYFQAKNLQNKLQLDLNLDRRSRRKECADPLTTTTTRTGPFFHSTLLNIKANRIHIFVAQITTQL